MRVRFCSTLCSEDEANYSPSVSFSADDYSYTIPIGLRANQSFTWSLRWFGYAARNMIFADWIRKPFNGRIDSHTVHAHVVKIIHMSYICNSISIRYLGYYIACLFGLRGV